MVSESKAKPKPKSQKVYWDAHFYAGPVFLAFSDEVIDGLGRVEDQLDQIINLLYAIRSAVVK